MTTTYTLRDVAMLYTAKGGRDLYQSEWVVDPDAWPQLSELRDTQGRPVTLDVKSTPLGDWPPMLFGRPVRFSEGAELHLEPR